MTDETVLKSQMVARMRRNLSQYRLNRLLVHLRVIDFGAGEWLP